MREISSWYVRELFHSWHCWVPPMYCHWILATVSHSSRRHPRVPCPHLPTCLVCPTLTQPHLSLTLAFWSCRLMANCCAGCVRCHTNVSCRRPRSRGSTWAALPGPATRKRSSTVAWVAVAITTGNSEVLEAGVTLQAAGKAPACVHLPIVSGY